MIDEKLLERISSVRTAITGLGECDKSDVIRLVSDMFENMSVDCRRCHINRCCSRCRPIRHAINMILGICEIPVSEVLFDGGVN